MKRGSTYWASITAIETVATKGFATIGMFHRIFDHIVTNHRKEIMRKFRIINSQIAVCEQKERYGTIEINFHKKGSLNQHRANHLGLALQNLSLPLLTHLST
jgi:hypothetical protein